MEPQTTEPYRILCFGADTAPSSLAAALANERSIALTPAVSLPDDLSLYDAAVLFAGSSEQDGTLCMRLTEVPLPLVYVGDL